MKQAFEKKFTTNDNNVRIVMCCASCKYHMSNVSKERTCKCRKDGDDKESSPIHPIEYLCNEWEIDDTIKNGAKSSLKTMKLKADGHIKRKEYFKFLDDNGYTFQDGRKPFEREHGSIYLDGKQH